MFSTAGVLIRYYPLSPASRKHADALTSILKAVDLFTNWIFESDLGELRSIAFAKYTIGIVRGHHLTVAYVVDGKDLERWIVTIFGAISRLEMGHRPALRAPEGGLAPEVLHAMDEAFQGLLSLS